MQEEEKQIPQPQKTRLRDDMAVRFTRYSSGVTPLHAAAFGGPIGKALQLVAIFPG